MFHELINLVKNLVRLITVSKVVRNSEGPAGSSTSSTANIQCINKFQNFILRRLLLSLS